MNPFNIKSSNPNGIYKLVKGIRDVSLALGEERERSLYPGEMAKLKSLRG